jgi:hypothetical protein
MSTPKKSGLFGSPSGTPNGQLTKNEKREQYLYGKDEDLQNAITILRGNSNNNTFKEFINNFNTMNFDSRTTSVNPNSALFMDKKNEKVYKIGLWDKCKIGIRKEYISYKKISNQAKSRNYVHTPKMLDCKIIPGTKYALLVITYQKELENAVPITHTQDHLYEEAETFLKNLGITHRDLLGNIYAINKPNYKTFFIIDFEDCTFNNNNNKFKLNNTSNEKLKNMDNKVKKNNLNSPPQTCVKKRKPGTILFGSTTPNSPVSRFSLGNNKDPFNRFSSFVDNSPPGSPYKSPRTGGKKNKSKKK